MTFVNIGSDVRHPRDIQSHQVSATTAPINGPMIPAGTRNLKITNNSSSLAYVQQGDAVDSPAGVDNYYYIIPSNNLFIVNGSDILFGQLNVALSSGTGNVDFIFSN